MPYVYFFFFIYDRDKHMAILLKEALCNGDHLIGGLALGKDHFGKADAVRTVEIKEKIFALIIEHAHETFLNFVCAEFPPLVGIK
jgi:hypothetical protein